MAEGAFHVVVQVGEPELADVHGHRARLDLREVEDVVDEEEKVRPRRVDGLGELRLLAREIAVGILGELVRQDEEAVERRAQLVRHVGEKLGLVLRGEGELLGFLLESFASLLHLLVLALHLHVLVGEEAGLFLQLLVGVLELFLPALQLSRERLGLGEEVLRPHVRLDGVDHDADALRQLIEEGLAGGIERIEGGELEDGLDLPFEVHG